MTDGIQLKEQLWSTVFRAEFLSPPDS